MNGSRIWPAVQVIGRTIACNKSDILQQGIRLCNQNNNVNFSQNATNSNASYNSNFDGKLCHHPNLIHTGKGSYLKVVSKNFSTGVQLFLREFTDGENEHAHDVLCSLPAYKYTTVDMKLNKANNYVDIYYLFSYKDKFWPSVETNELVNTFLSISKVLFIYNSEVDDLKFNNLFTSLAERMSSLNDHQLTMVLYALSLWPPLYCKCSKLYDYLWKTLDKICYERRKTWNISQLFLVADYWYALRITKLSMFFSKFLFDIGGNIRNLTPTQFVQFMFYTNLNRQIPAKTMSLTKQVEQSIKSLSIEELGIIAMGLFKTQTFIRDIKIIESVIEITEKNLNTISNYSLGSILKFLNKSFPGNAHIQCYNFLEKLSPYLPKFNNFVHLQVSLLGNSLLVFHEDSFKKICSKFAEEMPFLRLKDIERFTYTLMLYKYIPPDCPDILALIIKELRKPERIVEINHFPRCFVSCVNYLVALEVFPHDLISAALQPSMVKFLRNDFDQTSPDSIGRELNELNWNIKIELPSSYKGYMLNSKDSEELTNNFMGRIPTENDYNLTHQERFLLDVQRKISAMIGNEGNVEPTIILPHFSHSDLVFCTTVDGKPVRLPDEFMNLPHEDLKPALDFKNFGLLWNVVMIAGRNCLIRETKELKGNLLLKKQQLTKLGYRVSVVPCKGYIGVSTKYKLECLEKCLQDSSLNLEGRREMAFNYLKNKVLINMTDLEEKTEALSLA